jgi:hypothetical protein
MRRWLTSTSVVLLLAGFAAPDASAQQSINIFLGGFTPRTLDARISDDVIYKDSIFLSSPGAERGIDMRDFNQATFGAEWLVGLGPLLEAGLGLGFYQRTVPTVYTDFVNANGAEIRQDLKFRIVPFTATARVLPFGRRAPVQPYFGGGVGVYMWRYSETGQWLDAQNNIFIGNYVGKGEETGPVVLAGLRFPVGYGYGDGNSSVGFEVRWQDATAALPANQAFAGSRIDLGGLNYLFTINFRF